MKEHKKYPKSVHTKILLALNCKHPSLILSQLDVNQWQTHLYTGSIDCIIAATILK